MELPNAADAMYKTWWSLAQQAANTLNPDGSYAYGPADLSSAASQISKTVGGPYESYNPIGLSQLFGIARRMANAAKNLFSSSGSSGIDTSMIAEAPWSRSLPEQAAMPMWQARITMTYTDPEGVQQTGISVVNISQVLPSSVDSLMAQMQLRVQDQLSAPPGTGTPRSGQLDSIDSITLLAV